MGCERIFLLGWTRDGRWGKEVVSEGTEVLNCLLNCLSVGAAQFLCNVFHDAGDSIKGSRYIVHMMLVTVSKGADIVDT